MQNRNFTTRTKICLKNRWTKKFDRRSMQIATSTHTFKKQNSLEKQLNEEVWFSRD